MKNTFLFSLIILLIFYHLELLGQKNDNAINSSIWFNIKYIKCMNNKLPCECEEELKNYFVLQLDTIKNRIFLLRHENTEIEHYNIKKFSKNNFNIYLKKENQEVNYGRIIIKGKKIIVQVHNNRKSEFRLYGLTESKNDIDYYFYNLKMLNNALIKRGYDPLETIVSDSLYACHCNKDFGKKINLVSNIDGSKSWIIEVVDNNLIIHSIKNVDPSPGDTLIIEKFSVLKWKKL